MLGYKNKFGVLKSYEEADELGTRFQHLGHHFLELSHATGFAFTESITQNPEVAWLSVLINQ